MRALSIRQPWAFAVVMGFKPVENRVWPTSYRGPLLIHAGLREERADVEGVIARIAAQTGRSRGQIATEYGERRHLGGIVGQARLVDCVTEMASPWFYGPYGFVLAEAARCELVPCKGALGLFEVPGAVLAKVTP